MRIAIISPGRLPVPAAQGGAVETLIDTFLRYASEDVNDIDVYSVSDAITSDKVFQNKKITYYQQAASKENALGRLGTRVFPVLQYQAFLRFVRKNLKKNRYDCVIIENRPMFLPFISKWTNARIYLHIHNENFCTPRTNYKKIPSQCDGIIVVSEYIKEKVTHAPKKYPANVTV